MKVAIVGMAGGYENAPYTDPSWEIWGLNDLYLHWIKAGVPVPRFTRWWELHGDTPLTRARRQPDHFDYIKAMDIPVYYLHGEPPTPNAVKLDVEALEDAKASHYYFACTNAYQIALALSEGAEEIALYGTPLQANREVVVERPCVAWWLGLAAGRGVSVKIGHDNPVGLLSHPLRYALDDEEERRMVYWACEATRNSLDAWLPREAERLGMIESETDAG